MGTDLNLIALAPALTHERVTELARLLGARVGGSGTLPERATALQAAVGGAAPVLRLLTRDELRAVCRAAGLDDAGRSRDVLAARLLGGAGERWTDAVVPHSGHLAARDLGLPVKGDLALVRSRRWLVDAVTPPTNPTGHHRVALTCLDDDAPGRPLEVVWERELGARVVEPNQANLEPPGRLDDPNLFGAWLYALRWNCVTATDARLLQAPFRAGIRLLNHQITPLERALRLPRANLFVADDVGLGKTIEAGLVLQELTLRQRVDFCLVVCPPAVTRQWRDEMRDRFGLNFEIVDRTFVARRRQERGFGVNPFTTHTRFILSYALLRRPEYREPLLAAIGDRARRSLLILDEAHNAAPASGGLWTRDSETTRVVRDVAPRFENRLFLSATPHNGHSNSFSALLELLDPQRFTRGVPVEPGADLDQVLVRRLKSDLAGEQAGFPERRIVRIGLRRDQEGFVAEFGPGGLVEGPVALTGVDGAELELSDLLDRFTDALGPTNNRARFVLAGLQKRLFSSVDAFWRTLKVVRAGSLGRQVAAMQIAPAAEDDDLDDEQLEILDEARTVAAVQDAGEVPPAASDLLDQLVAAAERARGAADLRVAALTQLIARTMCAGFGDTTARRDALQWNDRRLIVFTEYGDTLKWLKRTLGNLCGHTHLGDQRIGVFHGGMGDDLRGAIQKAFNGPPQNYPVRILLCTDAAREGVNLQGWCADLLHFDVPWNPARLEQRNGRIDRTLQREPVVRCGYFVYHDRPHDRVLETLVTKTDRIARELGSLGTVLIEQIEARLADGLRGVTAEQLEAVALPEARSRTAGHELESGRVRERIRREVAEAGRLLDRSRRVIDFDERLLRRVVRIGTALAAGEPPPGTDSAQPQWTVPALPHGWDRTLDVLRPAREPDEAFWEWRRRAPRPCVFEAPELMTSDVVHLHLQHPFVQRVLDRFRAQGTAAHDLERVTAVAVPNLSSPWVIAFGRLSLFGTGAARLHEQLVSVAAPWSDVDPLVPVDEATERERISDFDALFASPEPLRPVPMLVADRLQRSAGRDQAALWPAVREEATALGADARIQLGRRAADESAQLTRLLEKQRDRLDVELGKQLSLGFAPTDLDERRQYEADRKHMERRRGQIDHELLKEPAQVRATYEVMVERIEPLGLLYLWPRSQA